ncbi:hypothetical protein PHYC_01463 [Phycisphaerales bacterium]|nr:hypothetical protein PHYC_01463 [Phycisphaerales bacterium]
MDHDAIDKDAFDLMRDIERQTPDEIRRKRSSHRIAVKARIVVQPGNSSDLGKLKLEGVLGDISANGCRIMTALPLRVGDIYRIDFRDALADLPMTFVRCVRCHLVREGAYESGFQTFHALVLPDDGGLREEAEILARGRSERA